MLHVIRIYVKCKTKSGDPIVVFCCFSITINLKKRAKSECVYVALYIPQTTPAIICSCFLSFSDYYQLIYNFYFFLFYTNFFVLNVDIFKSSRNIIFLFYLFVAVSELDIMWTVQYIIIILGIRREIHIVNTESKKEQSKKKLLLENIRCRIQFV